MPRTMSSRFTDAGYVEQDVWQMRLDDWRPGRNRALIDALFNGAPPYDEQPGDSMGVQSNINELSGPRYMADARRSLQRALKTSDQYFKVEVDYGPVHKRGDYGNEVTRRIARAMKGNRFYSETIESQIALKCLHGIGPAFWIDRDRWWPTGVSVQDTLIPPRTLRSMENLDRFAIFRQLTHEQLWKMTHGTNRDPGWQMDVVDDVLNWVADQTTSNLNTWAPWMAPQNIEELRKEDPGLFATSAAPTVDVWDYYFHEDMHGKEGWRRCMILDTPYSGGRETSMPSKNRYDMDHGRWLYKPNDKRVYASKLDELVHFMFGDATSTAPFRYHGVRSLGWLLYPFCQLQNRLYSKFIDHLFENLLNYIRADRKDDYESFLKLDLHRVGLIPSGVQFVRQEERWQINQQLVELGFTQNQEHMDEAAAQYREGRNTNKPSERETATAVIARVNAAAALVGALQTTTYEEMTFQWRENCRRFCRKDSTDKDVRKFRADVLAAGVPPDALDVDRWDIQPDKIMGNGNKMMAMAMVQELMATYHLHDPQAQREILEIHDREVTDNAALAKRLTGLDKPDTSPSVRAAQNMVGTIMAGIVPAPQRGENPQEMIETLLHSMATIVQRMGQTGPTPDKLAGLQTFAQTIGQYIQMFAGQGKENGPKVKEYGQDLKQLMQAVDAMGKAMQKQAQQGGNGAQGPAPQDMVKAQTAQIMGKIKMDNARKSHAQRTAQKQVSFEMQQQQDAQRHQLEMAKEAQRLQAQAASDQIKLTTEARRGSMKNLQE